MAIEIGPRLLLKVDKGTTISGPLEVWGYSEQDMVDMVKTKDMLILEPKS